jgi:hypothetical protein
VKQATHFEQEESPASMRHDTHSDIESDEDIFKVVSRNYEKQKVSQMVSVEVLFE